MHDIKLWIAGLLFLVTFFAGCLITLFQNKNKQQFSWLIYLDLFGRGIILGAAIFHFLPEGLLNWAEYFHLQLFEISVLMALTITLIIFSLRIYKSFRQIPNFKMIHSNENVSSTINVEPYFQKQQVYSNLEQQNAVKAVTYQQQNTSLISKNSYLPLLLLGMLSIHAFSEGIVLGADLSLIRFSSIAIAILLHKVSEALALSCIIYAKGRSINQQLFILLCFALMTPFGILFGTNLNFSNDELSQFWEGCFDLIVMMLFLYIVFNCRLSCPLNNNFFKKNSAKISFALGLILMGTLSLLVM